MLFDEKAKVRKARTSLEHAIHHLRDRRALFNRHGEFIRGLSRDAVGRHANLRQECLSSLLIGLRIGVGESDCEGQDHSA